VASEAQPSAHFTLSTPDHSTRVVLTISGEKRPADIMQADVSGAISKMKLAVPIDEAAVAAACEAASEGKSVEAVIAAGKPLVHGVDAKFLWSKKISGPSEKGGRLSHYLGRLEKRVVKAGEPLAKLVAETPGSDGLDVYGRALRAQKGKPLKIRPGLNVREQDNIFYAEKDGLVRLDDGKLLIDEIFLVEKNLDFEVGNIDFPGSVIIQGGILDLFQVKAGGSVQVGGLIEAANITAGGDVEANGGITGKRKGVIRCAGTLSAKFLINAEVYAQNDVCVETQMVTSKVMVQGSVKAPQGAIAGGEVTALGGIDVETIGSDSAAMTTVVVGVNYALADIVAETEKIVTEGKKKIAWIDSEANAAPKNHNARMAERLKGLLAEKSTIAAQVAGAEKRRNGAVAMTRERARPVVIVRKMINPGVVIRLGDLKTTIHEPVRGPLKVIADRKTGVLRFVPISG